MVLSIGEFSRVTQLTIKALRLYHEKGILVPDFIDESSGYRYYGARGVEKALVVRNLKEMGFSLDEIRDILEECRDDREIIARVEKKLREVEQSIGQFRSMKENLSLFLQSSEGHRMKYSEGIELEDIPDMLVCGLRFKGKYSEVGQRIGMLFRKCGRQARDRPFSLYYDGEFKEEDADIEVCVEVKKKVAAEGIDCRKLKGGKAVAAIHRGPYETIGKSYQKLFEHCAQKHLAPLFPTREQYLKSPGFIFKGNPKKYLTKLIVLYS
jgi:DNA-binding transcriptional MerR regulator